MSNGPPKMNFTYTYTLVHSNECGNISSRRVVDLRLQDGTLAHHLKSPIMLLHTSFVRTEARRTFVEPACFLSTELVMNESLNLRLDHLQMPPNRPSSSLYSYAECASHLRRGFDDMCACCSATYHGPRDG